MRRILFLACTACGDYQVVWVKGAMADVRDDFYRAHEPCRWCPLPHDKVIDLEVRA